MTVPNPTGKVGSGLLARATFAPTTVARVVIPLSALQEDRPNSQAPANNNRARSPAPAPDTTAPPQNRTSGKLFVVTSQGEQSKVTARSVRLGQQLDGKVQILSGLNPGDRYVSRAGRPLKDGDPVRLSILSAR